MNKNKSLLILLTAFLSFGSFFFANNESKETAVASAETAFIDVDHIEWNNQDYSFGFGKSWAEDTNDMLAPLHGYCLLPIFKSALASEANVENNLLKTSVNNCNVNDHILINGEKAEDVADVKIYAYPTTGFFIYVPASSITFSDEYPFLTINVLEGMTIDGTGYTSAVRFEYRGFIGSDHKWEINPESAEEVTATFEKIEWNNIDYGNAGGGPVWVNERTSDGVPSEGYCLLVGFKPDGQDYKTNLFGASCVNLGTRGILGLGYNADTKIKVNGVSLIDVKDSVCFIYPNYGLFFYIPDESITFTHDNYSVRLELLEGLKFGNVSINPVGFEFDSDIGVAFGWELIRDDSSYNNFDFSGIAGDWNNKEADSTHTHTILSFGTHNVDFLKNDKKSDEVNQVSKNSSCGNKITINGIPLNQHQDAVVNYAHQYCYLYLYLSKSSLIPNNGYKIVTLHIEEGTIFWDTKLPEVYLYLYNNKWVQTRPETPEDSDYDNALSINDVFSVSEAKINSQTPTLQGEHSASLETFSFFVDYKLDSSNSGLILYALGANERSGIRLVIKGNSLSLFDATKGNTPLGNATLETFSEDEWFSLFLYTRVVEGKLSIYVAIDDIIYIHASGVSFDNEDNIGSYFTFYSNGGVASFKKATLKADNKKPVISYSGKAVYGVIEGSDVIDFSKKCSAYDLTDKDVSSLIEYHWPEGSVIDGKINKGTWNVEIVASDSSNNKAYIYVLVICTNELEVTVTFDGENATTYRIGDSIACIPDPVKEADEVTYEFVGWYYNDRLWDFENDYVVSDMNLVSKYIEKVKEYRVSFSVDGLSNITSYDLYFSYGAQVNASIFEREGYQVSVYVNNEEVTSFVVKQDMEVKLVYTNLHPTEEKKGCKGEIASVMTLLSGVAIALLVLAKKKGEKDYE